MNALDNAQKKMEEGALAYAQADRSDPFTLRRIRTHEAIGISTVGDRGDDGKPTYYSAEAGTEPVEYMVNGEKRTYLKTVYRNVQRP